MENENENENSNTSTLVEVNAANFAKRLLSDEGAIEREAICMNCMIPEITDDILTMFANELKISGTNHLKFNHYTKHLRNWISKRKDINDSKPPKKEKTGKDSDKPWRALFKPDMPDILGPIKKQTT